MWTPARAKVTLYTNGSYVPKGPPHQVEPQTRGRNSLGQGGCSHTHGIFESATVVLGERGSKPNKDMLLVGRGDTAGLVSPSIWAPLQT